MFMAIMTRGALVWRVDRSATAVHRTLTNPDYHVLAISSGLVSTGLPVWVTSMTLTGPGFRRRTGFDFSWPLVAGYTERLHALRVYSSGGLVGGSELGADAYERWVGDVGLGHGVDAEVGDDARSEDEAIG